MKKITIWLIASFLWIIFLLAPLVYYFSQVNFPIINVPSMIIIILLLLLPVMFIAIAKITKKEKFFQIILIVCTILNFASICVSTFGFTTNVPYFYPIISYTESEENYLILDTNLYADDVFRVFPQRVPNEAENVYYKYYCDISSNTVQIIAEWTLPGDKYDSEKNRFNIGHSSVAVYDCSSFAYNLVVEFKDQENTVRYVYEQGDIVK